MVTDTHIKDNLYPKVKIALEKKQNVIELTTYISKYLDRNSHILFDTNFSERLIISNTDQEIINRVTGISVQEVDKIISESATISKISWVSNAFTVMMAMAIRYFIINKMSKEAELCIIYISCLYYILLHKKSFPLGPPNREIMDYTLNKNPNVTNSFIIKKEGSVFGMLKYTGTTSHEFYKKELIGECTDDELNIYLSGIRTRIGSNLKNLARYFYDDYAKNHYFNKDIESYDEEDFHMTDSTSLAIAKLASKVATNLVSYRFNRDFIERVSSMNMSVSSSKLSQILENMLEYHRKDLERFISSIIELYIQEGNNINEVSTIKFLAHALNIYKTNSTKPNVLKIKSYLDKWMSDSGERYGNKFIRNATIDAYRKAMFMVFVYTINKDAK